jgi:signal transduction histidine kinase
MERPYVTKTLMTLHKKTLLVTALTLLALFGLLYVASQVILNQSFQQLENQYTTQNAQRAMNALQNEIDAFRLMALGWSKWDDVYQFVDNNSQAFIDSNLTDTTFVDSDLDLMMFVDKQHNIVYSKAFDNDQGVAVPVSEAINALLASPTKLLDHDTVVSELVGILKLPEGYMITLSLPILTSQGEGPINGTLIWGRYLTETRIDSLSKALDVGVTVLDYDNVDLSQAIRDGEHSLRPDYPYFTIPVDAATITGYTVVNDMYGQPIALLQVELPRTIYAQGQQTITYFLLAMLLIGVIYSVVNVIHLERNVLRRLTKLSGVVTQVRTTGNLKLPISIPGNDELATLGVGLQSMLDALDASQRQLHATNAELEQRVQARTSDLTKAIEILQFEVAERQRAQEQAQEASRFKTQILATVSHDSRTPLSTIMLYTDSMRQGYYGAITEKQAARLEGIMASANQLLSFINNLLDEAQLNAGTLTLKTTSLSPTQLIHDIGLVLTPQAERKGLILELEIEPKIPSTIECDAERLKQVILNLVDNAIKFTEQGRIVVGLRQQADQLLLSVTDTGKGIPQQAQSHIFDAFWQVNDGESRRGVGLGLSIVKQLITLMGGTITVKSELGHGTTFLVSLPLHLPQSELALNPSLKFNSGN